MLELRNLRRKYHNPVRSLCVKFEEILRQVVEFAGSAFIQRTLKRTTSSSPEDSPESSSGSQSPAAFTLRCRDLSGDGGGRSCLRHVNVLEISEIFQERN